MRVGSRWRYGQAPPSALPRPLIEAVRQAETGIPEDHRGGSWTLTWLEDRPVAEFDDGLMLVVESDGTVRIDED